MRKLMKIIILWIALVLLSLTSYAASNYPDPTDIFFVNDFAGVLNQTTKDNIASLGKQLEDKTGAQVVLVTINSLDGQDIDSYANELFTKWGIGQKEKDNGILILNSVGDRMLRIEVGYGLEGAVTDIKTADIREQYMNPYLKENNYNAGLYSGYTALVSEVAREYNVEINNGNAALPEERTLPPAHTKKRVNFSPFIIVIFIVLDGIFFRFRITSMLIRIFFWSSFFRGGRGGGGRWGGGSGGWGGGGGGSSGGGGRSGGGGSSGGY